MPTERLRVSVNRKEFRYISNILSVSRIFLMLLIILGLTKTTQGYKIFTLFMMILAMLADGLDGYMARRLKEVSALGKILDPVCDKICIGVIAIAVTLLRDYPWWAMGSIILRDMAIIIGGILMVEQWTIITSSNIWGKATSIFQSLSIIAYAFNLPYKTHSLTVALMFTGVSSISYGMEFYHLIKDMRKVGVVHKSGNTF
jgi:CDP-diacylglycerol--glycerol-3-phosphate 3-phosphatidyltransferase